MGHTVSERQRQDSSLGRWLLGALAIAPCCLSNEWVKEPGAGGGEGRRCRQAFRAYWEKTSKYMDPEAGDDAAFVFGVALPSSDTSQPSRLGNQMQVCTIVSLVLLRAPKSWGQVEIGEQRVQNHPNHHPSSPTRIQRGRPEEGEDIPSHLCAPAPQAPPARCSAPPVLFIFLNPTHPLQISLP